MVEKGPSQNELTITVLSHKNPFAIRSVTPGMVARVDVVLNTSHQNKFYFDSHNLGPFKIKNTLPVRASGSQGLDIDYCLQATTAQKEKCLRKKSPKNEREEKLLLEQYAAKKFLKENPQLLSEENITLAQVRHVRLGFKLNVSMG